MIAERAIAAEITAPTVTTVGRRPGRQRLELLARGLVLRLGASGDRCTARSLVVFARPGL